MKKALKLNGLILIALTIFGGSNAEAKFFSCKSVSIGFTGERSDTSTVPVPKLDLEVREGTDQGLVVMDSAVALCRSGGSYYRMQWYGAGATLHLNNNFFTLSCPLVGKRRFNKRDGANFTGIRLTATAGVGASVGVFMNHALGVCVLNGATVGLGASAAVGFFHIEKIDGPEAFYDGGFDGW